MKRREKINKIFAVEELTKVGVVCALVVNAYCSYQDQPGVEAANLYDKPLYYSQYGTTHTKGWNTISLGIVAASTGTSGDACIDIIVPPIC